MTDGRHERKKEQWWQIVGGRDTKEGRPKKTNRQTVTVGRQTDGQDRQASETSTALPTWKAERRTDRTDEGRVRGKNRREGTKPGKHKTKTYLGVSISPFKRDTAQSEVVRPIVVQLDTAAMKGESALAAWTSDVA